MYPSSCLNAIRNLEEFLRDSSRQEIIHDSTENIWYTARIDPITNKVVYELKK